jgi:hypothetical protein
MVGGWSANPKKVTSSTLGKPFKPRSKSGYLSALRGFFCDLQEWGLAEIHFDVRRAFRLPDAIPAADWTRSQDNRPDLLGEAPTSGVESYR